MSVTGKLLILGNWKMQLKSAQALDLTRGILTDHKPADGVTIGLCPTFPHLLPVGAALANSGILLGGQDCHNQQEGAFTGSVSAAQLADIGCSFTLVGHSERRLQSAERSPQIREKAQAAIAAGLHVVLCIGESLDERESGVYAERLGTQLHASFPQGATREQLTIAYEPVWAIGTGRNASASAIAETHQIIKTALGQLQPASPSRILYGGSVNPNNALEILQLPVVDGVLVGGASLNQSQFAGIIKAAAQAAAI